MADASLFQKYLQAMKDRRLKGTGVQKPPTNETTPYKPQGIQDVQQAYLNGQPNVQSQSAPLLSKGVQNTFNSAPQVQSQSATVGATGGAVSPTTGQPLPTSAPAPSSPGYSNPNPSDVWTNGPVTGATNYGQYEQYNPTYTAKYKSGIQAAQEKWYYQFLEAMKQGKANMGDLDRFLGYQKYLGLEGNKTRGGGKNITEAQKDFASQYAKKLQMGYADLGELDQYLGYVKAFGLEMAKPSKAVLQQLSAAALNGSKTAQEYIDRLGAKNLSGIELWEGFDTSTLQEGSKAYQQYIQDIPYSAFTKTEDRELFEKYQEHILSGKQLDGAMVKKYKELAEKWNLEDMTDPYVRQRYELEQNKKEALEAQDIALNQGMATMDANSFNQMNQLQQQMSERGMGASGIAQDAYMRAQMQNNVNYQQAYAEGAGRKATLEQQYDEAIGNSRIEQAGFKAEQEAAQQAAQIEMQKVQTEQDKFLTQSTGYVYINGQMLQYNGKPLTTIEYGKLSEEIRSNMAQEALTGQKNAQDYALGQEKNDISRQKIAADLQIATSKLKLDYAKLDYNYAKLESDNAIAQDKIRIAADNAQTSAVKGQITALGKQLDNLTKQITAYQKAGDKPPKSLVDQYNAVNDQISALVGGSGF